MYVIERSDGKWVSDPNTNGTGGSYTPLLQRAKVFATRQSAERDCCPGNEHVVSVEDALQRSR